MGGGHVPRPLQQRVLRAVPPTPGAHPQQLRGQKHQSLGHEQKVK